MVAEICSDGTSSRSAAGEIHPALPKLRDQLQSRGRHGASLHREAKRHRSRETVERICQTPFLATLAEWLAIGRVATATPAAFRRNRRFQRGNPLTSEGPSLIGRMVSA